MTGTQRQAQWVVVLIGLPGAGKSQVALALAEQLGMHRICRDSIRQAMFPRCEFSPTEKRAANRATLRALEVNCALGRDSVLDGRSFSRLRERIEVDEQVKGWGAQTIALWLDCPRELARQRVAADPAHIAADRTPALVDLVADLFEPPAAGCLQVDARLPLQRMVEEAIRAVRDCQNFA